MSARRLMVALAVVATVVGAGASSVLGARSQVQTTTVRVSALDTLRFTLSRKSAPHGTVKFIVTNKGAISHDFWIAGKKTKTLGKGKSATLIVTLKKGKFPYKCTIDGHAAAGMKGTFTAT
jgi:plastocyanin